MNEDLRQTAFVLAAGGDRVIPWETGVLAGLVDAGIDIRRAGLIVGTSAGSSVAARLALGVDPREDAEQVAEVGVPPAPAGIAERAAVAVPNVLAIHADAAGLPLRERCRSIGAVAMEADTIDEAEYVERAAGRIPGGDWPPSLLLMAVDAETGERIELGARDAISVGRGVAAARALPGVLPPVTVAGRRLMDAVVASGTNADVAATRSRIRRVIVITPARAAPDPQSVDAVLEAGLARESDALSSRDVAALVIRAGDEARAAMGEALYGVADAPGAVATGWHEGMDSAQELQPAIAR
jgi:NTE family protein